LIDACLAAIDGNHTPKAVACLQELIGLVGDVRSDLDTRPSRARNRGVSR
jgi:hypothetical protein